MACCWSIKNPEYPERVYKTSSGITALDFSVQNPNLLAVGMYNGTIAVYNVRFSSQLAVGIPSFPNQPSLLSYPPSNPPCQL